LLAISKVLRILKEKVFENAWPKQKSGSVEELCRSDCWEGVELSDGNGLVSHEDERYGRDEVRRAAKRVWLRQPQAAYDPNDHEGRERAIFLAVAAARPRVPKARERKRSTRIAAGFDSAQVSREEQEKSASLPLPGVRRPQSFRRPPLS
jgi:hypothetical protein